MSQKISALNNGVSRRQFIRLSAITTGAALLAACGVNGGNESSAETADDAFPWPSELPQRPRLNPKRKLWLKMSSILP